MGLELRLDRFLFSFCSNFFVCPSTRTNVLWALSPSSHSLSADLFGFASPNIWHREKKSSRTCQESKKKEKRDFSRDSFQKLSFSTRKQLREKESETKRKLSIFYINSQKLFLDGSFLSSDKMKNRLQVPSTEKGKKRKKNVKAFMSYPKSTVRR